MSIKSILGCCSRLEGLSKYKTFWKSWDAGADNIRWKTPNGKVQEQGSKCNKSQKSGIIQEPEGSGNKLGKQARKVWGKNQWVGVHNLLLWSTGCQGLVCPVSLKDQSQDRYNQHSASMTTPLWLAWLDHGCTPDPNLVNQIFPSRIQNWDPDRWNQEPQLRL